MSEAHSDAGEARLLEQARSGDAEALEKLMALHRKYLRQLVDLRLDPQLRSRVDASDVVQEAQLEATRRIDAYLESPSFPFRLWLRQLAIDQVVAMQRRHLKAAKRSRFRELSLPEKSSMMLARQLLSKGSSPSEKLSKRELIQRVRRAISSLPDDDREVLLMRTFEGLSFDEVGCVLQISTVAARKRHGRALLRLHKLLSEGGLTESQL